MPRGHGAIATGLQVSQVAQCTDDAPTDLLDHGRNIGIGGRLDLDEARLEAGLGAIQRDTLKKDEVEMEIEIDGAAKSALVPVRWRCP
jgi:hypothetical protein